MKKFKLPPELTRADFDDDEEFAVYVSTEAGEWASTGDFAAQQRTWQDAAVATLQTTRIQALIATGKAFMHKIWRAVYQPSAVIVAQKYRRA